MSGDHFTTNTRDINRETNQMPDHLAPPLSPAIDVVQSPFAANNFAHRAKGGRTA